ncbi:MAG: HlyD family efflux transporter periplasmic adaptor subunit [Planctomycetes bacterium]|nr:HlyD family efflux transporter periplasmic adaptor subunit [Planctomycetota bacterium]
MRRLYPLAMLAFVLTACPQPAVAPPLDDHGGAPVITNRIDIPAKVRQNLGITFAKVERRHVAQTLRLPGRLEASAEATLEVRAPLSGRVGLRVQQYQRVADGALLFKLDSPAWLAEQQAIAQADVERSAAILNVTSKTTARDLASRNVELSKTRLEAAASQDAAAQAREADLVALQVLWETRVADLEKLREQGAARASEVFDARTRLAETRATVAEQRQTRAQIARDRADVGIEAEQATGALATAELDLKQAHAESDAATRAFDLALGRAAALSGLDIDDLKKESAGVPHWRNLTSLEIRAPFAGIVRTVNLASTVLAAEGEAVLTLFDPSRLQVRAKALQADISRLADGLDARVLVPGGELGAGAMAGKIALALEADPDERVMDVIVRPASTPAWARPGIAVEVEVTLKTTDEAKNAVPVASVVRDELQRVVFRRDPFNPDKVIRITPEFGMSDGRWIVVETEVSEGDEVVLAGVYELKLTGTGKPTGIGHFHADGTWHAGATHD